MKVDIKCLATLVNIETCNSNFGTSYDLEDGKTVKHLAKLAGINSEDIRIAFVNTIPAHLDTVLTDGDSVALTPVDDITA